MNKKRILKNFGIIFLTFTISAMNIASGQQKNNSILDNSKTFEVYARGTSYLNHDSQSAAGKTASLVPIKIVTDLGLHCIAVDPKIIPYGSVIIGRDKKGKEIIGVAVDTGGAVKSRKASRYLAKIKGFNKNSPEYNAIVLDFYGNKDITHYWDHFTVIPYTGPCFKFDLNLKQKIDHLKHVKDLYNDNKLLIVSR